MGDIALSGLAEDAQISVDYLHPDDHIVDLKFLTTTKSFVTLISQDAAVVLTYFSNADRTAAVNQSWDVDETPPQAPPPAPTTSPAGHTARTLSGHSG